MGFFVDECQVTPARRKCWPRMHDRLSYYLRSFSIRRQLIIVVRPVIVSELHYGLKNEWMGRLDSGGAEEWETKRHEVLTRKAINKQGCRSVGSDLVGDLQINTSTRLEFVDD